MLNDGWFQLLTSTNNDGKSWFGFRFEGCLVYSSCRDFFMNSSKDH